MKIRADTRSQNVPLKLKERYRQVLAAGITIALALTGCDAALSAPVLTPTPIVIGVTINPLPTPTPLPAPTLIPSPTPNLYAALVNGQPITIAALEAEMKRMRMALSDVERNETDDATLREMAIELLIEQTLFAQEAAKRGITISDREVEEELTLLISSRGGQAGFQEWLQQNGYTLDELREHVRHELIVNAVRDSALSAQPRVAEYVHAYHIVVSTELEAQRLLTQLQNGGSFTALAMAFSIDETTRPSGGDLGWFTRHTGAIIWPQVEEAAFQLQPGETSPIIRSPIGYHIIRVTERGERNLTEADASALQARALQRWVRELRTNAIVERFVW